MIFDPSETKRFREATERVTRQPGITTPNRICKGCRATGTDFRKRKGTGTSRHNPIVWLCASCFDKEKTK